MAHASNSKIAEATKLFREHPDQWEAICACCGLCCHERTVAPGGAVAVDAGQACEYFDPASRLCTVYPHRFEVNRRCHRMTPRQAVFADHLPDTCAYVRRFRG